MGLRKVACISLETSLFIQKAFLLAEHSPPDRKTCTVNVSGIPSLYNKIRDPCRTEMTCLLKISMSAGA